MRFIGKETIEIDRELSDLDTLAIDFTKILEKHTNYVIVSGYVAILLGRSRGSEDIDVIVPKIDLLSFRKLYSDLKKHGFYCINAEKDTEIFEYFQDNLAVRFAKKDSLIPNLEVKWVKNKFDEIALEKTMVVKIRDERLCVSHLELQIAFKEMVLKSPKDLEDAFHIRMVAQDYLDDGLIQKYREMLRGFY